MASVGSKNVYRIFAGGNHSWVVVDDVIPTRSNYRAPSPIPNLTTAAVIQRSKSRQSTKPESSFIEGVKRQNLAFSVNL